MTHYNVGKILYWMSPIGDHGGSAGHHYIDFDDVDESFVRLYT